MMPFHFTRGMAPAAAVGGLLWIVYGVCEMLAPWGAALVYQEDLGYDRIINVPLFRGYYLPGSLALVLTALSLLGILAWIGLPVARWGKVGVILAYIAVGLAGLAALGLVLPMAPLSIAGVVFGSFALGAALFLAGLDAHNAGGTSHWTTALLLLGLLGLFLLPLRPLVWAVEWVPAEVAALFMALFGLGWLGVGYRLWLKASERSVATRRS